MRGYSVDICTKIYEELKKELKRPDLRLTYVLVDGKNRLASNSLLEALVWGRRAAWYMRTGESLAVEQAGDPALDGRHRALGADPLAIDDLARAAGTQAVEE